MVGCKQRSTVRALHYAGLLLLFLGLGVRSFAQEDLTEYGRRWDKIQSDWAAEQARHNEAVEAINKQSPADRESLIQQENARHLNESKSAAVERAKIHDAVIAEANRRTARGAHETSAPAGASVGTDPAGPKGRGMAGDADYGSGARTAEKVEDVLKDMGIKAEVKSTASTIEVGGDFNLTVNKEGALGKVGSSAHQAQVAVDARNKETYVSESMAKPSDQNARGQAGRTYVEIQDHKKKALGGGLVSDPADLAADPAKAHDMVKGTTKTMGHLSDYELYEVMRKNNIKGTPQELRAHMTDIKEGRVPITSENVGELQKLGRDVFETAEAKTRSKADADISSVKQQIAELEAAGNTSEAAKLREQLADSRAKMAETAKANAETIAKSRGDLPEAGIRGQAVETAGKVMVAVDILAGAKDVRDAVVEGDMDKLRDTAVQTADSIAGSPLATKALVEERLGKNRSEANQAAEEAARNEAEARAQEMRVEMRRSGMSAEDVEKAMNARAKGDDSIVRQAYGRMGKEMPKEPPPRPGGWSSVVRMPDATDIEAISTYGAEVKQNVEEVLGGMANQGAKAKDFVAQTGSDVSEIASGLKEKGVIEEIVGQQKSNITMENLSAGISHIFEKTKEFVGIKQTDASREQDAVKDLADFYIKKGADPADARRVAERQINKPSDPETKQAAIELKARLASANRPPQAAPEPAGQQVAATSQAAVSQNPLPQSAASPADWYQSNLPRLTSTAESADAHVSSPPVAASPPSTADADADDERARQEKADAIAQLGKSIAEGESALAGLRAVGGYKSMCAEVSAAIAKQRAQYREISGKEFKNPNPPKPPKIVAAPAPKTPKQGGTLKSSDGSKTVLSYIPDGRGGRIAVTREYDNRGRLIRETRSQQPAPRPVQPQRFTQVPRIYTYRPPPVYRPPQAPASGINAQQKRVLDQILNQGMSPQGGQYISSPFNNH